MRGLKLSVLKSSDVSVKLKYSVYLSRGFKPCFSSLRVAEDFIRSFESNFNDCLRSLNYVMSDVYRKFLDYYFILSPLDCSKIKELIDSYNNRLSFIFKSFEYGNQSFKITSFYSLFDSVEDVLFLLVSNAKRLKDYSLVNLYNSHLKTLSLLIINLKDSMKVKEVSKSYKTKVLKISYKKAL
jgi:hypothetical protein